MNRMKKMFCLLVAAAMLLTLLPAFAFAEIVDSGVCGNDLTWTLDDAGTLTVSGTGAMYYNYSTGGNSPSYYTTAPWGGSTANADRVKTVVIEDGVTSIERYAFYGCKSLASVTIPDSVTSIGEYAFYGCAGLASVTIPDSVTSIGWSAFSGCTGLESVTIGDGVTSIGEYAFQNCTSLASVTIGNGVTNIGDSAFYNCASLESLTIPDSVTSIGSSAFSGCPKLQILCNKGSYASTYAENQNYPYALLDGTDEENTFSGTSGRLQWNIDRRTCTLTVTCPGKMPTFSSTSDVPWASSAYKNYVRTAVIEDGATTVGQCAFSGCSLLASVTIPDGVTIIGNLAFSRCSSLASVTIPNSVTSIGEYAFSDCAGLASVTIPGSVTSIGQYAFYNCTSLESVTIPDSVTSIGNGAFQNCAGLASVTIPGSVTSIGNYAFSGCAGLASVTIPGSVTSIGNYAFQNCTGLASVTIPDGVTYIGRSAFFDCTGLTTVDVPASVGTVQSGAFSGCSNLESVYFYNRNCTIYSGATPSNTVVYGYAGSTAEIYADNNGLLFREIPGDHVHHFVVTQIVPATCLAAGYQNLACPCGVHTTEVLPAAGHTEATFGAQAATCGSAGYTGVTYCAVCNLMLSFSETIPATGIHTPTDAEETVLTAPTCEAEGEKQLTVKCAVCGEILSETTEAIPAAGHTEMAAPTKAPTCTEPGYSDYTYCAICGKELTEKTEIPAAGHTEATFGAQAATCGSAGYTGVTYCSDCNQLLSLGETIPATGIHTEVTVGAQAATCGSAGFTGVTYCSDCMQVLSVGEEIPATGEHTWDGGVLTDGKLLYTCTACGETREESVSVIGEVLLAPSTFVFNGDVQNPTVIVTDADGDVLTENTDYTLAWSDENSKDPGEYTVTVTGNGDYIGTETAFYTITKAPLTDADVTLSWTGKAYNGAVQQPTVTVKGSTDNIITEGKSYTVTYSANSKAPGSYTVTVKGMGNYTGTVKKTYTITKQPLVASNITLSWTSKAYNGSVQKPTVTVKSSHGTTITEGGSYTLTWSGDCKAAGTYTVTITGAGKFTGTVKKTFTITAASTKHTIAASDVTLSWTTKVYNNTVQKPTVTVKGATGNVITEGKSYTVSYSAENKNVGTYTVTVTGMGNYTGTVKKTYTITKQELDASRVTLSKTSFTYNGSVQQPKVTVKSAADNILTAGGSYTVSYSGNCKDKGTYTITVTGQNNYTGTVTKTFTIK